MNPPTCPIAFSKPTPPGIPGYDVNVACKLSYSGEDVTAENFLAVLKGDSKTTGKPTVAVCLRAIEVSRTQLANMD